MGTSKAGGGYGRWGWDSEVGRNDHTVRSAVLLAAPPKLPGNIWDRGPYETIKFHKLV